ncbi:hypothetical protein Ahia01_001272300, partial [Argonauta hians]
NSHSWFHKYANLLVKQLPFHCQQLYWLPHSVWKAPCRTKMGTSDRSSTAPYYELFFRVGMTSKPLFEEGKFQIIILKPPLTLNELSPNSLLYIGLPLETLNMQCSICYNTTNHSCTPHDQTNSGNLTPSFTQFSDISSLKPGIIAEPPNHALALTAQVSMPCTTADISANATLYGSCDSTH